MRIQYCWREHLPRKERYRCRSFSMYFLYFLCVFFEVRFYFLDGMHPKTIKATKLTRDKALVISPHTTRKVSVWSMPSRTSRKK